MADLSPEHYAVFSRNYLVHGLPEATVREIAALGEPGGLLARETLIRRGAQGADLFVILEGTLHVYDVNGEKLGEIGPAEVVGEIALVDAQPRSADVVAVSLVRYVRYPAAELRAYMVRNKDAGFLMLSNLARVLAMRLRQTTAFVETVLDRTTDPWEKAL